MGSYQYLSLQYEGSYGGINLWLCDSIGRVPRVLDQSVCFRVDHSPVLHIVYDYHLYVDEFFLSGLAFLGTIGGHDRFYYLIG